MILHKRISKGVTVCASFFILLQSCKREFSPLTDNTDTSSAKTNAAAKPNIIFIVADDVGYEVPTCNGGQSYSTPNLDAIANKGIRFTQAHSAPMCSPSRIMLLTGKYSNRNYTTWGYLNPSEKTIGNMLKDAGYNTCYTGKWQLDGGGTSITKLGWMNYSVWLPFLLPAESMEGSRYKSAKIYEGGGYLPGSASKNKYSDDIFTSYLLNFIDQSTQQDKPFFAYYAMMLCHPPAAPTPDDPEYATWNFGTTGNGDKTFYPSMVKYMDKKIGEIVAHIDSLGITNNTIIIFTGDNGCPRGIHSEFDDVIVTGGKHSTNEPGTNVPLLIQWPKETAGKRVSDRLIDFTDFLPTIADMTGIPAPGNYGILDGKSFYDVITWEQASTAKRTWIYDAFNSDPAEPNRRWQNWVQDRSYKLYESEKPLINGRFVKITKGLPDSSPLNDEDLSPDEKKIKRKFQDVLESFH